MTRESTGKAGRRRREKSARSHRGGGSYWVLPSGSVRAALKDRRFPGGRIARTFPPRPGGNPVEEARTWLERQAGALAAPATSPDRVGSRPRATLAELAEEYLEDRRRRGRSGSTIDRYRSHLVAALAIAGGVELRELDGPMLERIVDAMQARGWAPSTVHNRVRRLTGIHRYAVRKGYTSAATVPVELPQVTVASRPDRYTVDQVEALVRAARRAGEREHLAVLLAADAGLRRGEILRIRAEDVRAGWIDLPVRDAEDSPKSGHARRVPMTARLRAAAEDLAEGRAPAERLVALPRWTTSTILSPFLAPVFRAAGLRSIELHRLRHAWASDLLASGATLAELMSWGGWTPSSCRRYIHDGVPRPALKTVIQGARRTHLGSRPKRTRGAETHKKRAKSA